MLIRIFFILSLYQHAGRTPSALLPYRSQSRRLFFASRSKRLSRLLDYVSHRTGCEYFISLLTFTSERSQRKETFFICDNQYPNTYSPYGLPPYFTFFNNKHGAFILILSTFLLLKYCVYLKLSFFLATLLISSPHICRSALAYVFRLRPAQLRLLSLISFAFLSSHCICFFIFLVCSFLYILWGGIILLLRPKSYI